MRTFIALDLPSDFALSVAEVQTQLATCMEARYVSPRYLHLTLAFLGELDTSQQLSAARKAIELASANFAPVSLHPEGLGAFGNADDATVWMGVSPTPALMNLAKSVRSELSNKGIPFDQKPFRPHITLARHAKAERIDLKAFAMPDTAHATNVTIYKSDLTPKGAQHSALHSVTL